MGSMPNWFAKTKEMAAFDRYFSLIEVDEKKLLERFDKALARVEKPGRTYYRSPDALTTSWAARRDAPAAIGASIDGHFRGDWIHHLFPTDPATYGAIGGRFWPQVASTHVLDTLRVGVTTAIHKAMGDTELANRGYDAGYRYALWRAERENEIPIDDGIRPIAMSWNCVAPAGDDFFEVDALRGPSVVEFAIATPRPYGHGTVMGVVDDVREGVLAFGPPPTPDGDPQS